jgi:hypothetical protein
MAEVAAVDLRRVGERLDERIRQSGVLMVERARVRHACVVLALAFALSACSEMTHTVGVSDVNAVSNASGAGGGPPKQGGSGGTSGGGGTAPIADGSIGVPDAAIPDAAPQCADNVIDAPQKRVNLNLVVDTNFLVAGSALWSKVRRGILDYAQRDEAAGTGLGLRLIDLPDDILSNVPLPLGSQACNHIFYLGATVAQEPLPASVEQLTRTLDTVTSTFTTPLAPALQGAIEYAFSLKNSRPDEDQVVVLISDAFLDLSCTSTAGQLADLAASGRGKGIRSYMIEVLQDPLQILPSALTGTIIPLNPVASAGGTGRARSFHLTNDPSSDLADRLLEIQRDARVCEYALPSDAAWEEAWLAVDTGVGPGPLARLAHPSECSATGGAYVTYVDPTNGTTWARACPTSCAAISASARPPVWIVDCDPSGP